MNYYNEYDKKTAAWLRELIRQGLLPDGIVDERSIVDIKPSDLTVYTQCHFFAGIGGWSLALQLAGWPSDRPVWTGSCPCQPFSTAGKGLAQADERHLWPVFFTLIKECRPQHVFGEQVASAIGKGWLDGISADLETEGYACGATVLGAHSVGAPHIRQRLYWVADFYNTGSQGRISEELPERANQRTTGESGTSCQLADTDGLGSLDGINREEGQRAEAVAKHRSYIWSDFAFALCRDGKARRVPTEPAFFPLAHGIPARVVRLRGYGNAIVPQVAQAFIEAFIDIS